MKIMDYSPTTFYVFFFFNFYTLFKHIASYWYNMEVSTEFFNTLVSLMAIRTQVNPIHQCPIVGEANIVRYLCRLFPASSPFHYEGAGSFSAIAATDTLLDECSQVLYKGKNTKKTTAQFLLKTENKLVNDDFTFLFDSYSFFFFFLVGNVILVCILFIVHYF